MAFPPNSKTGTVLIGSGTTIEAPGHPPGSYLFLVGLFDRTPVCLEGE